MAAYLMLAFGTIFTLAALLLTSVSFATDHWLDYTVNRAALSSGLKAKKDTWYYTRYRGLFRTCFPGNETYWLDALPNSVDGNCLSEKGYELTPDPSTTNYGEHYTTRKHLMRAHFACFVLAILMLVVGCVTGSMGCWRQSGSILRAAGLVVFVAAFFTAGGMALFHGYEYLEKRKINQPGFPFDYMSDSTIKGVTSIEYGWSYILGWIGMGLAAVAAILFLCAAFSLTQALYEEKHPLEERPRRKGRNRAYDYQRQPYPEDYAYGGQPYPGTYPKGGSYPQTQPYMVDGYADYNGYRY